MLYKCTRSSKMSGLNFILLLIFIGGSISFSGSSIKETKEFAHLYTGNTTLAEPFIKNFIQFLLQVESESRLEGCDFSFSNSDGIWLDRNDIFFDTINMDLDSSQARLRMRHYWDDNLDLTFKFSSNLKQLVELIKTEATDKYQEDATTKIEQNIYDWSIYGRNFFHKSTKIDNLPILKNLNDWTVGYVDKFFPSFSKTFGSKTESRIQAYKISHVAFYEGIILEFGNEETDLSIEFEYADTIKTPETLSKIEISWKVEKEGETWPSHTLACSLSLLKILNDFT